jgi:hypothetical protein
VYWASVSFDPDWSCRKFLKRDSLDGHLGA